MLNTNIYIILTMMFLVFINETFSNNANKDLIKYCFYFFKEYYSNRALIGTLHTRILCILY